MTRNTMNVRLNHSRSVSRAQRAPHRGPPGCAQGRGYNLHLSVQFLSFIYLVIQYVVVNRPFPTSTLQMWCRDFVCVISTIHTTTTITIIIIIIIIILFTVHYFTHNYEKLFLPLVFVCEYWEFCFKRENCVLRCVIFSKYTKCFDTLINTFISYTSVPFLSFHSRMIIYCEFRFLKFLLFHVASCAIWFETWFLTFKEECRLTVFENRILR